MSEATDANANGTGGSVIDADALPVSEAARRLGVTLPRLQRALRRPEFAGSVSQGVRQTRTGTRTVTLVSVTVLEALALCLSEQKREQYGPNHYRSAGESPGALPAVLYQQRIADLEAANAELRADKERLYQLLEQAQTNLSREQTLRALPPPQPETPEAPPAATGGDSGGPGGKNGPEVTPPAGKANAGQRPGFWARLFARGKD